MSRNRDRLGGGNSTPKTGAEAPQTTQNTGFSFVVPTEFVELPSRGKFYSPEHPLHGCDSIEIRHMTAKEEDLLTSRTLLKKGIAIERLLQSIIIDKSVKASSLLVGDRNALVIAARVSGYGSDYSTKITCPSCTKASTYTFDLNEADVYAGDRREDIEITDNGDGTFGVTLPVLNLDVTFRLMTGVDEIASSPTNKNDRKRMENSAVTTQLNVMLESVAGDSSSAMIQTLVENMPSRDSRWLRRAYKLASPNIDLTQEYECEECGFEQEMEVPLTADFFWPSQ